MGGAHVGSEEGRETFMVQKEAGPNYAPPLCPSFIDRSGGSLERQRLLAGIVLGTGRWEKVLQDV